MTYVLEITWTMLCLGIMQCIYVYLKVTSYAQTNCDKGPQNVVRCKWRLTANLAYSVYDNVDNVYSIYHLSF